MRSGHLKRVDCIRSVSEAGFGLFVLLCEPFSSPEATILLVSTRIETSGRFQHRKAAIH